jgi:hypothetical protein
LDKYVEIQKIFSDFYFANVADKMKKLETARIIELVLISFVCLSVLVSVIAFLLFLGLIDMGNIFFVVVLFIIGLSLIPSLIEVFKHKTSLDEDIKKVIFPDINEKLYPLLYVAWSKTPLAPKFFNDLMDEHKIMKVDNVALSSDDKFSCRFNDMNFDIYEVENRFSSSFLLNLTVNLFRLVVGLIVVLIVPIILFFVIQVCLLQINLPDHVRYAISGILTLVWTIWLLSFLKKTNYKVEINGVETSIKPVSLGIIDRFKGLIVRFEMPKYYKGHTIIFENNEENTFVKLLAGSKYEKVELEDVEFNKRFSVYSTDQVEARYALTSGMMDRMLNLKQTFKSKYIRASFSGRRFVMGIQSDKDLFCLASLWKKSDSKDYQTMFLELISILKITDALNLQNDTGL